MSKNFTLKSCTSCMLPETYETFDFDENGTCNVCNNHKNQKSKIKFKLNILNIYYFYSTNFSFYV